MVERKDVEISWLHGIFASRGVISRARGEDKSHKRNHV